MVTYTSYSAWSEQCRAFLELHSKLDALCICDHGNRVLGSAFKNPEFENITNVNPGQVKVIRLRMAKPINEMTSVDFLTDRFIITEGGDTEFMAAKCGLKSLFVGVTKTLFLFGLTADSETEQKFSDAAAAMQEIKKYYQDADF